MFGFLLWKTMQISAYLMHNALFGYLNIKFPKTFHIKKN